MDEAVSSLDAARDAKAERDKQPVNTIPKAAKARPASTPRKAATARKAPAAKKAATARKAPNLDAMDKAYAEKQANGGKAPKAKKASTRGTTVQFFHDGTPLPSSQNKLSSVAWYFTKGIGGEDVKRISVEELRKLLADQGVADPSHVSGWSVPLPNGIVISAGVLSS